MSTLLRSIFALSSTAFVAHSLGQVGSGGVGQTPGINDWDKIVDQPEITASWTHSYVATGFQANEQYSRSFQGKYKCWGDSGSGSVGTAPFTAIFATLYDWTSQNWFTTTANSNGVAIHIIKWEDSLDNGQNGVQRWKHNPSMTEQERRVGMLHPTQG